MCWVKNSERRLHLSNLFLRKSHRSCRGSTGIFSSYWKVYPSNQEQMNEGARKVIRWNEALWRRNNRVEETEETAHYR